MINCPRCGTQNVDTARFCNSCGHALATPSSAEVRKTVSILFCDVVGSTSVGEQTDPEALRRVMARYFEEIRGVVARHGGVVEKFIGDAAMAVFGVPTVHEDDALRAVRAAAEIRDRLAQLAESVARERGLRIAWRTGINTGEVVAGDAGAGQTFVTGDAVNVAARLEQAAQPGEVLIGASTYALVRHEISTEQVAPISAKGKTEPLEAYRVLSVAATHVSQPARLEAPMVGRQRPRRLLADAYEQAVSDGVCHLFTVLGSAGVGKSRLVREFLAGVSEEALVLHGRCLSYGEGITYWPVAEIVRQAARLEEPDDEGQIRAKLGDLIDADRDRPQAIQRLGELVGLFEGGAAQDETFWAVRTMITSLARRKPVVVVLDDLQWAEPSLLDLVDHLADWIGDAPVLLICLARRDLLDARPGWGGGKTYATTVTLEPLSAEESRNLVVTLLGQVDLGGQLAERIIHAAEGNPLFVEEMLRMLVDRGQLTRSNGGWVAAGDLDSIAVPPTIQALLAARIDGLDGGERIVLEHASIEGKVFHLGAVAELAPDAIRDTVPERLLALTRKELVRPARTEVLDVTGDDAFRFRHLLIRDAAYASIPKLTRAELHTRFAAWLSRVTADRIGEYDEILGYHYEQAFRYRGELGPIDEHARELARLAATHLGSAGQRALDRTDVRAATKLLRTAAELLPPADPLAIRLRANLGLAMSMAGELRAAHEMLTDLIATADAAGDEHGGAYAELMRIDSLSSFDRASVEELVERSQQLLEIFEKYGDAAAGDRATFELARHHFFAGRAKVAEQTLTARLARYGKEAAHNMLLSWLPGTLLWGPTPVPDAVARISEMLDPAASRAIEANALMSLGLLHALVGEFDAGRELARRGIAIREELGQRIMAAASSGNFLGPIEMLAGEYEQADMVLSESARELEKLGERGYASTVVGLLAEARLVLGRVDDADRYARQARDMASEGDVDAQVRSLRIGALVLAERGSIAAAIEQAGRAVETAEGTDYLELRGSALRDYGEVLLAAGDREAAIDALRRARATFVAKGATVPAEHTRRRLAELGLDA